MNSLPGGSSGIALSVAGSSPVTLPQAVTPKPTINFADTIKQLENQVALYGPGPHTQTQKEELVKVQSYLQRARIEQQKMMSGNKMPDNSMGPSTISPIMPLQQPVQNMRPAQVPLATANGGASSSASGGEAKVLDKRRLQELVKEVDPLEQLDDDVEDVLLQIADDFIENVVSASCQIAKHRKSNTLEVKDVQLYLERSWNMWVPGFGSEEIRPFKKAAVTEAHKQRMALIRKTLKKY